MFSMRRMAWGALAGLFACTPAELGQDDGFRARVAAGCTSEASCEEFVVEAEHRVSECMPNSIGYVRCNDARSNLVSIERRVDAFARRRQYDAQKLARAAAIAEERARQEAAKAEKRAAWIEQAVAQCHVNANGAACRDVPPGLDATASSDCFTMCREVLVEGREHAYLRAESDCVSRVVESKGAAPPDCHFQTPEPDRVLEDRRVECASECRDRAAELMALQGKGPARPRPPSGPAGQPDGMPASRY